MSATTVCFKCIRELRTALGDDRRQLIKLVSGHGYRLDAEVTSEPAGGAVPAPADSAEPVAHAATEAEPAKTRWSRFVRRGPVAFAAVAGLGAAFGLAIAAPIFGPDLIFPKPTPTIAVMTMADASNDSLGAAMASGVTDRLIDGLARIENVRVVARPSAAASAKPVSAPAVAADFVVTGELRKDEQAWTLQVRMTKTATQEVQPAASISVNVRDSDPQLQQSRLAAGVGYQLALRINTLLNATATDGSSPPGAAKAAIEQATASIMQTTRERFAAAQAMLEKATRRLSRQCRHSSRPRRASTARDPIGLVRSGGERGSGEECQGDAGARVADQAQFYSGARSLLPLSQHDQ